MTLRVYGPSYHRVKEDINLCIESVFNRWHSYQCTRKRGFGPNGEYCKFHSPESVEKRKLKQQERYEAKQKLSIYGRLETIKQAAREVERYRYELDDAGIHKFVNALDHLRNLIH